MAIDNAAVIKGTIDAIDLAVAAMLAAGAVPVDYSLDGQSEQLGAALQRLIDVRPKLLEAQIQAEGPTEVRSQGWV